MCWRHTVGYRQRVALPVAELRLEGVSGATTFGSLVDDLEPTRYCARDARGGCSSEASLGQSRVHLDDVETFVRLLLYATPASRRRLAARLLDQGGTEVWALLATTARSSEDRVLRARCVEVLGLAAAAADPGEAEAILKMLLDPGEIRPGP
jgi:hypothetical protein